MPNCTAITLAGHQCTRKALLGGSKCAAHRIVPEEYTCIEICADGHRCTREKQRGSRFCKFHKTLRQQKYTDLRNRLMFIVVVRSGYFPWHNHDYEGLITNCIRKMRDAGVMDLTLPPREIVNRYIDEVLVESVRLAAPLTAPVTELGLLSRDRQNTHTSIISSITNDGVDFLMRVPVESGQSTLEEIHKEWSDMAIPFNKNIYDDMTLWYGTRLCQVEDDWMYRKVLDHAWAFIKTREPEERCELTKRLHQECNDATGMCFAGHVTRIVNTFVGIVEEIRPFSSKGETIQDKMAAISLISDPEERMARAREVIAEMKLTDEEAEPWLDALA